MDVIKGVKVKELWKQGNYSYCMYKLTKDTVVPSEFANTGGSKNYCLKGENLPKEKSKFYGTWERGKNGKSCFKVFSHELELPDDNKSLIKLLSGKNFKGIGKATAKKVVDVFGDKTVKIIQEDIDKVANIIGEKKANTLKIGLTTNKIVMDIYEYIGDYTISPTYIKAIAREYGSNSIKAIKENPYILIDVQGIGLTTCDKIAASTKSEAYFNSERVKAGIIYILNSSVEISKKLFLYEDELKKAVIDYLNKINTSTDENSIVDVLRYDKALKDLIASKEVVNKFGHVALKWVDDIEFYIAKDLVNVLTRIPLSTISQNKYQKYFVKAEDFNTLSESQRQAIVSFINNRISVITGGPGTGKTTVLKSIISAYKECEDGEIVLLTPTGKAARRVTEATGYHAQTIHSKLRIYSEDCGTNCDVITNSLVIVDEMSMVDTFLMNKLMRNINEDCHVVFVGDVNQLPSVSAGDVLRDIINSGVVPVTYLTENFRQAGDGSTIIKNASLINSGEYKLQYDDSFLAYTENDEKSIANKILDVFKNEISEYGVDNVAVLCPLRQTFNGKYLAVGEGLNPLLKKIANPREELTSIGLPFDIGDRVMQTKNCENSANGDIGTVIGYDNEKYEIEWESHPEEHEFIDMEDIGRVVLAYSYSIHKSQGAEVDCVIIPLSKAQSYGPIFKRNLIYTAVTRAKKKVIFVGCGGALKKAVDNSSIEQRNTTLCDKIKDAYALRLKFN